MPNSKKISQFTKGTSFEQTDLLNVVRSGANLGVPFSDLAAALGVTGSINVVGGAGTPVLEQPSGTVNNIRTIENGNGILASVSPQNGIIIKQNITVDATGAEIIVDKNVAAPIFRSIVAGDGVTAVASGNIITVSASIVAAANTVVVNSINDFPTAVAGVITLVNNTNYVLGAAITTTSRFAFAANNSITAFNILSPTLTYTGTGTMFTAVDVNLNISEININCPNAQVFDLSAPTATQMRVTLMSISVENCLKVGIFNNLGILNMHDCAFFNNTDGITTLGSTNWIILSLSKIGMITTEATFKGIDFGTSVHRTIEIDSLVFIGVAGGIGITGAAASANLVANSLATVINSTMTGITPLTVITTDAIRWDFKRNTGIPNTLTDALLGFNGNSTETVISIINTPVLVNAVWVLEDASKMTIITAGRATYVAEQDDHLPIDVQISVIAAGGGSNDVTVYLALNGSVITNTGRTFPVTGSTPQTISFPWQLDLTDTDYLEVYIENNTGTTHLIVESATLRVN